jgi:hypothetical protein
MNSKIENYSISELEDVYNNKAPITKTTGSYLKFKENTPYFYLP